MSDGTGSKVMLEEDPMRKSAKRRGSKKRRVSWSARLTRCAIRARRASCQSDGSVSCQRHCYQSVSILAESEGGTDDSQSLSRDGRNLVVVPVLLRRVDVQAAPLGTGCRGRELSEFRCEALELVVCELSLLFLEEDDVAAVNCSGRVGQPRLKSAKRLTTYW